MKNFLTPLPPFARAVNLVVLVILVSLVVGVPITEAQTSTAENGSTTPVEQEEPKIPEILPYQDELDKAFESGFLLGRGGSTLFEDDFNSYNNGNLNGQGNWTGSDINQVQGTDVKEGAKAVLLPGSATTDAVGSWNIVSPVADGQIVFYIMRDSGNGDWDFYFNLYAGETLKISMWPRGSDSKLWYWNGAEVELQDCEWGQWYEVKIEWRSSDGKVRISIDGVDKTDWIVALTEDAPDTFHCRRASGTLNDNCYLDHIAEYPIGEEEEVETKELIQNTTTGAEFYLDKTISYGDFLIVVFLLILIIAIIIKIIFDTEIPKRINFKRQ